VLTHPKGSIYLLGGGAYGRACLRILNSRACLRILISRACLRILINQSLSCRVWWERFSFLVDVSSGCNVGYAGEHMNG